MGAVGWTAGPGALTVSVFSEKLRDAAPFFYALQRCRKEAQRF